MLCTGTKDKIGQEAYKTGSTLYTYKGLVSLPPLGMVDDVLGIAKCGTESIKLNSIIESKISTKRLEMEHNKCFQIHVGTKSSEMCPELSVHNKAMKNSSSETYLGDILTNDGKIDLNIQSRYEKGVGVNNSIFAILQEISFGTLPINFLSLSDSTAASCATPFTLNGGFITFKASIIFFDPYPQPTLKEASPNIFENVLNIKTLSLFLNKSKPEV